jgi:NADH-quinone oxidoreductase subunit L
MPITGYTMLVGCLAIIGAGIPFLVGFSGYYSKDVILAQVWLFSSGLAGQAEAGNPAHRILFFVAAGGAAITAFYMFRLWYLTFLGRPRNQHRFDQAHESPRAMTIPLLALAGFAIAIGWPAFHLTDLIEQARPAGTLATSTGGLILDRLTHPSEHLAHTPAITVPVTLIAFATALGGLLLATIIYCWRLLDPEEIRQQFRPIHRFLLHKWWFDELYDATIVQPALRVSRWVAWLDTKWIDGIIHWLAACTRWLAGWQDTVIDRWLVDGFFDGLARRTWHLGLSLRRVQTGSLRQYVLFIVAGTVGLFLLFALLRGYATSGF